MVRDSFTYGEQTSAIFKFLVDQTQTPNSKVKVATMNYLRTLTQLMEPSEVLTMSNLSSAEQEMALGKQFYHLNNYFNFHVCLSFRASVRPSVRKLTSIPASVSQNVTNKSCLVCFESENFHFG